MGWCARALLRIRGLSGFFSVAESAFRPDGDLLLSWQKKAKPPAPRFGPFGVPSLRYCYGAIAAYGSLRSPTSRACTTRRVCCAHAPSQHRNEASLTSRSSASAPWVFTRARTQNLRAPHERTQEVQATPIATSGRPSVGVAEEAAHSATCVQRRREM